MSVRSAEDLRRDEQVQGVKDWLTRRRVQVAADDATGRRQVDVVEVDAYAPVAERVRTKEIERIEQDPTGELKRACLRIVGSPTVLDRIQADLEGDDPRVRARLLDVLLGRLLPVQIEQRSQNLTVRSYIGRPKKEPYGIERRAEGQLARDADRDAGGVPAAVLGDGATTEASGDRAVDRGDPDAE